MQAKKPHIVVIGGGTGSFTLLSGLKQHGAELTALVNMADDGGSTGILRDELGVLPPGDVRQCLVALSDVPQVRDLFSYRFVDGSLKGHTFGNLFLSAVEKMTNNFENAVDLAAEVLHIEGSVIPITIENTRLVMGKGLDRIKGEYRIGNMRFEPDEMRPTLSLDPPAELNERAKQAIMSADEIVIAPGNLYGTLAPALLVNGLKKALEDTPAKIVYICNLVTKPRQTDGFMVHNFVAEIERFIGSPVVDYVVFNTNEPPPSLIEKYTRDGEFMVQYDLEVLNDQHYQMVGAPLVASEPLPAREGDAIAKSRTLIRHDESLVAREVMKLLYT